MWLMELRCICYVPDAAPNDTLITPRLPPSVHYLVTSALQTKLCCMWFSQVALPTFVFPFRLSQNYFCCDIKRDLKSHWGFILQGEKGDLTVAPSDAQWTAGLWDSPASNCPNKLQDAVRHHKGVKQRTSPMWGQREMLVKTKGWDDTA